MGNTRKAPKLINKKPKLINFYQMEADIAATAFRELGYPAFRLLLVLMGTADNFNISTAWVCERANIGVKNYTRVREELVNKKYILYTTYCGSITIDYESIAAKVKKYLQGEEKLQAEDSLQDEEKPQNEEKNLQAEEKSLHSEEKSLHPDGYNIEIEKTKNIHRNENANEEKYPRVSCDYKYQDFDSTAAFQPLDYEKEVDVLLAQMVDINSFASLKRAAEKLVAEGKTYEWIYEGITSNTNMENWKKYGLGCLFKGFTREKTDEIMKQKEKRKIISTAATSKLEKKVIPISMPFVNPVAKKKDTLAELNELLAE